METTAGFDERYAIQIPGKMTIRAMRVVNRVAQCAPKWTPSLEIGAFAGRTTYPIATARPDAPVISIDPWDGSYVMHDAIETKYPKYMLETPCSVDSYVEWMKPCPNVTPIVGKFPDACPEDMKFGFIFFDDDTSKLNGAINSMFAAAFDRLVERGIICGDDFDFGLYPDFTKAVHKLATRYHLTLHVNGPIWYVRR